MVEWKLSSCDGLPSGLEFCILNGFSNILSGCLGSTSAFERFIGHLWKTRSLKLLF